MDRCTVWQCQLNVCFSKAIFFAYFLSLKEATIYLLSRSLGCNLLLVWPEAYAFIWSKEFSHRDSLIVAKAKQAQNFTSAGRETEWKKELCGLGTTQTELYLNLSSISSQCCVLRQVVDLEVSSLSLAHSIDVGLLPSCVIVLWP